MTSFFPRKESKLAGTRRSALDLARGRLVLVSGLFVLAYILIAARVFDLSVIQGSLLRGSDGIEAQQAAAESAPVPRADIVDRNGVLLATSLQTASLYADPGQIPEPEKVAAGLVKAMPDLQYGDVLEKLQRKIHFVWLKRNLTPQEQYAVLTLGQPGLMFREEMRRVYPQGPLAAHMVGYTDIDGRGLAGVERSFDSLLRRNAEPLRLTLDVRLQHILRRETLHAIGTFSAKAGAGVIMDVTTGQVLAAVSLPDFDPNDPGSADDNEIFNRVSLGTYELGSTFKIFTLAALFENVNPPLGQLYDARAPLVAGRFTISDFEPKKRMLSLPEVFMYSSNIGAAEMAQSVGTDGMKKLYEDLGLLSSPRFEIGEIGHPQYPQPWRDINTLTAAFGHGIAVSPLQMVAASCTVAGGGTLVQPTLVLGEDGAEHTQGGAKIRILSEQTSHRMRQLLRLVVTDGTGTNADVPGYDVGGKTGTAEKPGQHGYDSKRLISSFIGFFPVDAPKYAVYIMIDEPHGTRKTYGFATGGFVAAPAVARVISSMAAVLGIPPEKAGAHDLTASLRPYLNENTGGSALASY